MTASETRDNALNAPDVLNQFRFQRHRNSRGRIIPIHHAFRTVKLNSFSRTSAVVLPVLFVSLLWLFMPLIFEFWGSVFNFWMMHIYGGHATSQPVTILGRNHAMPLPDMDAQMPSKQLVVLNLLVCFLAFALSFLFPNRAIPLTYLLRTLLVIQASASVNRLLSPDFFPYTLRIYMLDAMSLCVYMLVLMPVLLGLVYYIFDYPVWRKCLLTLLMIGYFLIFIPCQYMLHAYIIHEYTMLMLPLMYMFFGTLLDVLAFVSIYAYAMSWRSRRNAMQGRGG